MSFSLEQGKRLVDAARKSIVSELKSESLSLSEDFKEEFSEKRGIFVTLKKDDELRGCIGYPVPKLPLHQAVVDAAKAAAFKDPRFPPLAEDEVNDISIEISVLTVPEELEVRDRENIVIGRDGLIIDGGYASGLLLPQVPVEQGWDQEEFLEHICTKAGLPSDAYKDEENKIYIFQAQIFCEEGDQVVEKSHS